MTTPIDPVERRLPEALTDLASPRTPDYFIDILPALLVFGAGLTIMVAPLTTALMTSVPESKAGVASAINNAISRVGSPLVTADAVVGLVASTDTAWDARAIALAATRAVRLSGGAARATH